MTEHFVAYSDALRRLHDLIKNGRGDDEDADRLREEMDISWTGLQGNERKLVRRLSASFHEMGDK